MKVETVHNAPRIIIMIIILIIIMGTIWWSAGQGIMGKLKGAGLWVCKVLYIMEEG